MSRFTRHAFHKSSYSAHLPSPPDTDSDFTAPNRAAQHRPFVPVSYPSASLDDPPEDFMLPPFDASYTNSRPKKSSSLSYSSSGVREARERTIQRSLRSFVVVIPPPTLSHEHGHLGPTLSSGPLHRLSQGILMPLFPTMYGQITAIAREFNFPSTAGICLYLQWTDAGVTITPRISDESWPFLWSHEFDSTRPYQPGIPPISGRIEFDIDFQQARWYPSWVSSRDSTPTRSIPVSPPTRPPSRLHHRHIDSRTTFEDEIDDNSLNGGHTSLARNVPKKLSLVDRYETSSVRSAPKTSGLNAPAHIPNHALSPIPQASEPPSANMDLETRVNSWRASASLKPTPLAVANGQTSLEPANLPNNLSLDPSLEEDVQSELHFEDFTWSISSVGPRDYLDGASIYSSERVPSVHLANRIEGSVCLTSPTCTSFGPSDYDEEYIAYPPSIRVPTPDVAMRMWEDCPPTPSTATSWGPPLSYPSTPASVERPLSIDIAYRFLHSRPVTPTTATSWGPPSWPSSPALSEFRPPSIHMADRGEFSLPNTPLFGSWDASVHLPRNYPHFNLYPAVYPNFDIYPTVVEGGNRSSTGVSGRKSPAACHSELEDVEVPGRPWSHVWPYTEKNHHPQATSDRPWKHVWPYTQQEAEQETRPWEHVWPYTKQQHDRQTPPALPWEHVWPYIEDRHRDEARQEDAVFTSTYPIFNLYPAVYPHFSLYPSPVEVEEPLRFKEKPVWVPAVYPTFDLYPCVYPYNLSQIYRSKVVAHEAIELSSPPAEKCISVKLPTAYPTFDLYPSVYPHNLERIYKLPTICVEERGVSTVLQQRYPYFQLYAPIYPHIRPYPSLQGQVENPCEPSIKTLVIPGEQLTYPWLNIYPAVYPYNLDCIYTRPSIIVETRFVDVTITPGYPFLQLYTPVYPDVRPYPSIAGQMEEVVPVALTREVNERVISMDLPPRYPFFNLYTPVYPNIAPYPSLPSQVDTQLSIASRYRNRRTHAELHASVFIKESLLAGLGLGGAYTRNLRPSKTHAQLHEEVMLSAASHYGSPRRGLPETPLALHSLPRGPSSSQRISPRRTSKPSLPPPSASPSRRLPTPPFPSNNHNPIMPSAHQRLDSWDNGAPVPPARPRGLPATPRQLRPQSSFDSSTSTTSYSISQRMGSLEHLQRSRSLPFSSADHGRSSSMATPISPVIEQESAGDPLQRSHSIATHIPPTSTMRTPPRRKDSIVLQRVKALNTTGEEIVDVKASVSRSRLDQSRYSVFS